MTNDLPPKPVHKKTIFSSPEGLKKLKEALYSPRVNDKMVPMPPEWHEMMEQRRQAERNKAPLPVDEDIPMTSKPESATVVDLQQAREEHMQKEFERGWLLPDGTRLPPWSLYDPPPPYMVHPCQVIALPVKSTVEPDDPGPDTQPSLF